MLVRQMLAAARSDGDPHEDDAPDAFAGILDARLADVAAACGAFGIADALERQLASRLQGGRRP